MSMPGHNALSQTDPKYMPFYPNPNPPAPALTFTPDPPVPSRSPAVTLQSFNLPLVNILSTSEALSALAQGTF